MDFFKVVPLERAKTEIVSRCGYLLRKERISVYRSVGRVIADDVSACEQVPPFDKSVVDGFAVAAADTYGARESVPSLLRVVGNAVMGRATELDISSGEAVYVPTGGMLPRGADAVIMIENTQSFGDEIAVLKPVKFNENVLKRGDDIDLNSELAKKGQIISALQAGAMAAAGVKSVSVYERIKISVISTGDELADDDGPLQSGKIRDVNSVTLSSAALADGCSVYSIERIGDDESEIEAALKRGLDNSDIVLISGGSSVGEKDYTYKILNRVGNVFVKGIALKPGKPTIVAEAGGKLVFGLPGHPMAAYVVYRMLCDACLREARGTGPALTIPAITGINFPSSPGRTTCQPVKLEFNEKQTVAYPLFGKSGLIDVLRRADGFIVIPDNAEGLAKGAAVGVTPI